MTKEIMLEPTNYNDHLSTLHLVSHPEPLMMECGIPQTTPLL